MSTPRYVVRWVQKPGFHVVVIDTRTHEIVWDEGTQGTQDEAWAEADRLNRADVNPLAEDEGAMWR